MSIPVIVPSVGESVNEGRIAKWLVADGSTVKVDDTLLEIETEKATQGITAQAAGVLKITVPEGEIVQIGQTVGELSPVGDGAPSLARPANKEEPRTSPAAAAIIRDQNLDATKITPTGPGGIVTKEDAVAATKKPEPTKAVAVTKPVTPAKAIARTATVRETRQPMSMIRKRTAERLLESQNQTATLTTFNEVDMSAVMELRSKYNERFEKRHGVKLGFMSIFVKAAVDALLAFPTANARIDGTDIVYQHFYDISVAVSTDKGLFVPVIRDVDALGFAEIEKAIGDLAKKARDGKIGVADMQGGTFTITNGGIFGSMLSTPILNPPQTAILGMHSIQKRAVVVNDQIVIRPMMYLALSYDHRLIDGREAVQFLVRIKECIEDPERILFGV